MLLLLLLLVLTGHMLALQMWRGDVGEAIDFCTSNGAQVTCDTFRYLCCDQTSVQRSHVLLVSSVSGRMGLNTQDLLPHAA